MCAVEIILFYFAARNNDGDKKTQNLQFLIIFCLLAVSDFHFVGLLLKVFTTSIRLLFIIILTDTMLLAKVRLAKYVDSDHGREAHVFVSLPAQV